MIPSLCSLAFTWWTHHWSLDHVYLLKFFCVCVYPAVSSSSTPNPEYYSFQVLFEPSCSSEHLPSLSIPPLLNYHLSCSSWFCRLPSGVLEPQCSCRDAQLSGPVIQEPERFSSPAVLADPQVLDSSAAPCDAQGTYQVVAKRLSYHRHYSSGPWISTLWEVFLIRISRLKLHSD